MKKILKSLAAVSLILIFMLPADAQAQLRQQVTKNFGIGAMFGEPTGVTVKVWSGNNVAFDVGGAWSLASSDQDLHLHASMLFHSWFNDRPNVAFYYGIGGRILFADDSKIGVRIPFGLTYVMGRLPLDLFVEVAPILDLVPDTGFAGNGAVGARIYF